MATRDEKADRWRLLRRIERRLELPLALLSVVWLVLLIVELTRGLNPLLTRLGTLLWVVFILDFAFRLVVAPDRALFMRRNWLGLIALALPAFRLLRIARIVRAARAMRLVRLVTSVSRSKRSLLGTIGRHGAGYVAAFTMVILFAGAAGMYAFERHVAGGAFRTYADALWFTSMILTTMGSQGWPQTTEGRVLALLLSLYALGILGYVAGVLASFFVDADAADDAPDLERITVELQKIAADVAALRGAAPAIPSSGTLLAGYPPDTMNQEE